MEYTIEYYERIKREYFISLHHINIVGSAITAWSKSKMPDKDVRVNRLTNKLHMYETQANDLRAEISKVEAELTKKHTKFTPLIKK